MEHTGVNVEILLQSIILEYLNESEETIQDELNTNWDDS